jgi:hypothetical protein
VAENHLNPRQLFEATIRSFLYGTIKLAEMHEQERRAEIIG